MRILLVDGDPLASILFAPALRQAGHLVIGPVGTVREGLDLAHSRAPDLVVVEVDLGPGGSGIALARGVSRHLNLPSLYITGERVRARAANDAALGIVAKPVAIPVLLSGVAAIGRMLQGAAIRNLPPGIELFDADGIRPADRYARSGRS